MWGRRVKISIGRDSIRARVARNLLERALGFMFWKSSKKEAILFKGGGCFWMLFTPIKLQLLCVKKGKISKVFDMEPFSIKMVCVECDYVVEVANFRKVKPGEMVKLPRNAFKP